MKKTINKIFIEKDEENMKKLLSIGSIVLLKDGKKKLMIYGRKQLHVGTNKKYDYVGCLYPEGNISIEYSFMFNNEDIEEVYFIGYKDEEEIEFQKVLSSEDEDTKLTEISSNSKEYL